MPLLNPEEIATSLLVTAIGGIVTWLFGTVLRLRRDMDQAFTKIRALELAPEDEEEESEEDEE